MNPATRSAWARLALGVLLVVTAAGCMDSEDDGPVAYREDVTEVTVPADGSIEFKLFVEQGDSFEFEWTAPQVLFFDFHGEPDGDTSGDFTSHKAGNAGSDEGSFTAPFSGTHGWYWENAGDEDVVVVLETAGRYRVVGEVG